MVHPSQQTPLYSRPEPLLRVTVARRGRTRVLAIRPWFVGCALAFFSLAAVGTISAAAYMIYHDDLLGAAVSRQVEMQHAYEDRIAALRSELDRVTSRHVVQTEGVEQQLATLLDRQATLELRQSTLDELLDKARVAGVAIADGETRLPRARPDMKAVAAAPQDGAAVPLGYLAASPSADVAITGALLREGASDAQEPTIPAGLSGVQASLDEAQGRQSEALDALGASVANEAARLSEALKPIGIEIDVSESDQVEPQGGPYIPPTGMHFVERAVLLERTLDEIRALRRDASAMPVRAPVAARYISSGFGNRVDPFLKRPAFHSGLDLVAERGTEVRATAAGTVVSAGPADGYGNMVEIRHAGGVATRYGHMSAIFVAPGTDVVAGTPIGQVGSTGRSTGPHLHYETRRNGTPTDPKLFLAAGRALKGG
jgi:murein DD-endopeptidase MepM/ murein hydrolase activator NlpD